MATIIKVKMKKAEKLQECAEKVYKHSKKLMEFIEDEILDSEEFEERGSMGGGGNFRGGSGGMGGGGNFRDEDDYDERWDDEEDYEERRGVAGTGRYGRGGSRYGGRRRR